MSRHDLLPSIEADSMHTEKQRLAFAATMVAATSLLALNNIKVCLRLGGHKITAFPSDDVLRALAPVIQRFDCCPEDVDSVGHGLTDRQIRALQPGSHCITSLSLYWSASRHSSLHLLANFVNLQHLELHLDEANGLGHLSSIKGLLELQLTIRDTERPVSSACGDILQSNKDTLLHVSLSAGAWDDKTYMGLLRLCNLRTFTLAVCSLQKYDAALLGQLRPSQSMHISIHKVDDHEVVMENIPTLHNLTSLTLIGLDLTSIGLQPQPTLQVLTLRSVFMRSTQLRQVVQNSPSLKQMNLHELQGLLLNPDTLCTILQLRHLTMLCLSGDVLEGLTAARACWLEAFIRAQQSIGMAQPKIHVTCVMANQTRDFYVDYTGYPVLCGAEFDERRATYTQRCWAQVAGPGFRMGKRFVTGASTLQGASTDLLLNFPSKVNSHARDLASSRSWAQVESKHPLGILIAVAMLGINVACLSNKL